MNDRAALPWLDWLRFLAAFLVVICHARSASFVAFGNLQPDQQSMLARGFFAFTRIGMEAVVLFFVLSGYLVGGKLIERVRGQQFQVLPYVIDRATRIWIPLLPAILLSVVIAALRSQGPTLEAGIGNMLGLQGIVVSVVPGNGPLWTLSYEIWFYVLAGSTAAAVTSKNPAWGVLFAGVALLAFAALQTYLLLCLILGSLAYLWRPQRASWLIVILSLAIVGIAVTQSQLASDGFMKASGFTLPPSVSHVLLAGSLASLIANLTAVTPPQKGGLSFLYRSGSFLAAFSYTLYLTHYPILGLISEYFPPAPKLDEQSIAGFVVRIAVAFFAAFAIYWVFERNTALVRFWVRAKLHTQTAPK